MSNCQCLLSSQIQPIFFCREKMSIREKKQGWREKWDLFFRECYALVTHKMLFALKNLVSKILLILYNPAKMTPFQGDSLNMPSGTDHHTMIKFFSPQNFLYHGPFLWHCEYFGSYYSYLYLSPLLVCKVFRYIKDPIFRSSRLSKIEILNQWLFT